MIYTLSEAQLSTSDASILNNYVTKLDDLLLFDIETTGFHRIHNHLVSITAAEISNHKLLIHQWFCDSPNDESELLQAFNVLQHSKTVLISFNGDGFDIPFLYYKYQHYNMFTTLNKSKSCDLYKLAKATLKLSSYKLKSIELALGIHRDDTLSGKECVSLYYDYLRHPDSEIPKLILHHNFEDVTNLVKLAQVITLADEKTNARFVPRLFLYKNIQWYLQSFELKNNRFTIKLTGLPTDLQAIRLTKKQIFCHNGDELNLDNTSLFDALEIYGTAACLTQVIDSNTLVLLSTDEDGLSHLLQLPNDPLSHLLYYNELPHMNTILHLSTEICHYLI